MEEALWAFFAEPSLFLREWGEIGIGGVLLFFCLRYLVARGFYRYLLFFSLFLLLAVIFQSLRLSFLQLLAEKGMLITGALLFFQVVVAWKEGLSALPSSRAEMRVSALAELLFSTKERSFIIAFPDQLRLEPYLVRRAMPVSLNLSSLNRLLADSEFSFFLVKRKENLILPAQVRDKESLSFLEQALFLTEVTDSHLFVSDSGKLWHVYRNEAREILSQEGAVAILEKVLEKSFFLS